MVAAHFIVGIIGDIMLLITFASSIGTFRQIVKKKSSENYEGMPYVIMLLSTSIWILYGSVDPDDGVLIVIVNSVGVTSQAAYLVLFVFYASKEKRAKYFGLVLLNLVFLGIVIAIAFVALHASSRRTFIGIICATFTIAMYGAPLSVLGMVIQTKSVEYMPFFLSFSLLVTAAVWFTFAMLLKDYYVLIPNAIGIVLGSLQIIVYFVYKNKLPSSQIIDTMAGKEKPANIDKWVVRTQDIEQGRDKNPA